MLCTLHRIAPAWQGPCLLNSKDWHLPGESESLDRWRRVHCMATAEQCPGLSYPIRVFLRGFLSLRCLGVKRALRKSSRTPTDDRKRSDSYERVFIGKKSGGNPIVLTLG